MADTSALISSVEPQSTTAKMAGAQPLESKEATAMPPNIPGGFPDTPSQEVDQPISVKPLPAADGAISPVKLKPGEKVPESITAQGTNQHVKLDEESYEKSDALAGVDMQRPPVGKDTIPESGLPMGTAAQDVTISTVGAGATTAALAGLVPKESDRVPQTAKESQEKAGVDPEASAVSEQVQGKAQVEDELKATVPEAPSTAEGTAGLGTEKSEDNAGLVAAAAAAGGATIAAVIGAKDALAEKAMPAVKNATSTAVDAANENLPDGVKEKLPVAAQEALAGQTQEEKREEVSPEVPSEVKQSITDAEKAPEAAGNTEAVEDKKTMEAELLKVTKKIPTEGEGDAKADAEKQASTEQGEPAGRKSTNGGDTNPPRPVSSSAGSKPTGTSPAAHKKKNRLSSMFSKLKEKMK